MIDKKVQILSKTVSSKQQGGVSSSVSGGSSSVVYNNIDLLSLDAIAEPSEHNAFSALRALYEQKKEIENRLIKSEDEKEADDSTFYTSLRTLKEINNSIKNLYDIFLRKDQADSTEHLITFLKGLKIGAKYSINEVGDAVLNNIESSVIDSIQAKFHELESTKLKASEGTIDTLTALTLFVKTLADVEELNVKETATILNAVVKASLSSPKFTSGFLGEGFRINQKSNGDWNLEIDTLTVRKVFQVFELLIQEVKHQGGVVVHSPAGGKITKVTDGGSYWKCEIESADTFFKDDLVLCQRFTGKVKRYWRAVTSAGDGYINLSKTDCEANSAIPEEGDEIATLGNKTNTARQSAYLISVVGEDAPYTAYYSGINSYLLKGKEHTRIGNLEGVVSPVFGQLEGHGAVLENAYVQGMIKLQNGKTVEDVIDETSDKLSGDINNINTSVSSVKNELGATITNVENNFNTSLNSTKNELNSSINKVQGDANAAKGLAQSAQDAVDELEIGGRNLISGSGGVYLKRLGTYGRKIVEYNGKISVLHDRGTMLHFAAKTTDTIKKGGSYVYSFKMCCNEGIVKMASHIYINEKEGSIRSVNDTEITTEWKMFYISSVAKGDIKEVDIHHYLAKTLTDTDQIVYLTEYKLEKGNKATDWTPAPEDTEAQISKSKEEAEVAAKAYADAQDNLLKTQQEAYADGKVTEAEKRAIADATNKVNAAKNELNSSISKVQGDADTAKGLAQSAQDSIDGLEIGGRNLYKESATIKTYNKGSDYGNASSWSNMVEDGAEFTRITPVNKGNFYFYPKLYATPFSIKSGEQYVVSFKYRTTQTNNIGLYNYLFIGGISSQLPPSLEWQTFSKTYTVAADKSISSAIFGFTNLVAGTELDVRELKLEKGNKATDWTPAPEDTEAAAKAYADAQDNLKQIESKAYADGRVTEEEKRAIADAKAKLAAAKKYADAQDALLKTQQEAYADGKVSEEEKRAIADAKAKLDAAKAYAEAQDEALKVKTDAYADGVISVTEAKLIQTAKDNLEAAKKYAEAQDALLKVETDAYADGKVTAEEERAIEDAQAKLDAAKAYAKAQDELLKTEQEAYADGKVAAEEKRAIADAQAKLDAAKKYAEAQDALLKTQQEAYADGIVTEAEQRAINEAQNRVDKAKNELNALIEGVEFSVTKKITDVEQTFLAADGKITSHIKETTQLVTEAQLANGESVETLEQVKVQINDLEITAGEFDSTLGEITKKQGEIEGSISNLNQTASSISASVEGFKETETAIKETANRIEATHEGIVLEASEKSAQKAIGGLEIGGRNLISGSGGVYLKRLGTYGRKIVEYNGKISVLHDRGTMLHFAAKTTDTIKKGGSYVYSFKMCCNEGIVKMASHIYINEKEGSIRSVNDTEITTEWKMFYISSVAKGDIKEVAIHHYLAKTLTDTDQIVYLTEYKLEKGNKATDWSPAPEDIEDKIETTRTEFDSKLEITKEAITATSTKIDGLTGRMQETEAKLEPDRLWVAVKDNSQKLIDDLDLVNRNYAYVRDTVIYVSNDFPRNKKQYLSLSLWGNFEEFANIDPFSQIYFSGNLYSPFLDYKYTRKSVNHIIYEGGYVDLSLETDKDLSLFMGLGPEELITKAKIDLGTKATDWTPAPEELLTPEDIKASIELTTNGLDVFGKHHSFTGKVTFASLDSDAQGKINSAQSTADSANRDLGALKGSLKSLAYQDKVEEAMLGETIIDGGYIKTSLIKANSITADKIDVKSLFSERIQTGNIDILEGATIDGLLKVSSGYQGNIGDFNLFWIAPTVGVKAYAMPTTFDSKGKTIKFFNASVTKTHTINLPVVGFVGDPQFEDNTLTDYTINDETKGAVNYNVELPPLSCVEVSCFEIPPGVYITSSGGKAFTRVLSWEMTNRFVHPLS